MADTLGVGLVGWGYANATFHAPLVRATPGLQLVAVSSGRAGQVDAPQPGCDVLPGVDALLARPDVALVVVATPNDTHHALAARALAAGKHVVVDKPLALTVAEADDLIARAQQARRLLSVFHNRRWDGDFLGLQQVLASGVLGRLTHLESHFDRYRPDVRARWREDAQRGGGLWYDLGSHLVDQALQLFGLPSAVWLDALAARDGALADDWCHAVLRYPGLRVVLHASALSAAVPPRFVVHGTAGSYVKQGLDTQEAQLKAGGLPGDAGWGDDPWPGVLHRRHGNDVVTETVPAIRGRYESYYAGLREALTGAVPHPPVTEASVREVMRVLEAGRRSLSAGAWQPLA